ncbi:MAG: patatin-like phospholipase family protein [Alphaproteobacteria bacterium]|nr:patatin-like phospholipase family protein [Alphaproteobacteria bacterium]
MTPSLADIPLLRDASPEALADAEHEVEWFSLPGGWPLFEVGEDADSIYFVTSGALGAFRTLASGERRLLGYIRAGEPVGEMALITGERHSAAVYAVRDTELLRLSRSAFNRLVRAHPVLMQNMARLMLSRSRQDRRRNPRTQPRVYSLIAASPTIDLKVRARALQDALVALGKTCAILTEDEAPDQESAWLDAVESTHDVVFLLTPIADSTWFRTCLRQADRMWVMARADARPSVPLLPDDPSPARQLRLVDVVLLHHGGDRQAASTEEWRLSCDASRVFHWRGMDSDDCRSLARQIAGQAVGLVLSGGGARAYAHIGVIRALREAQVPIDQVGGTSMGAIVAACLAMGWDDDEIEMRIRKAFVESNPLGDYVLPVVALSRGRRVDDRLQEHFGETLIEDLHTPFFAISTNLVAGAPKVHKAGLLRKALRASISLPGILPPVVDGDHGLLVDGAVLKNFPVDVMRALHRGPIIGVDVARRGSINPSDFVAPPEFFGWVAQHGLQSPPPIASLLMRAATISVDPWQGRDRTDLLVTPEMPDVDLRDWRRFDEAVAAGYEAAVAALKRQPSIGKPISDADRAALDTLDAEYEAAE